MLNHYRATQVFVKFMNFSGHNGVLASKSTRSFRAQLDTAKYMYFAHGQAKYRYPGDKVPKTAIPTTSQPIHIPGPTCSREPNTQQVDMASRAQILGHGATFPLSCELAKLGGQPWY
jgi:hypothetical protein